MSLVYIGGLDPSVTEGDLFSAFLPFGEILATHLPRNSATGKLQGFGYVEFEKEQDARNAIDNMHLTEFFGIVIRCNLAHTPPTLSVAQIIMSELDEFNSNAHSDSETFSGSETSQESSEKSDFGTSSPFSSENDNFDSEAEFKASEMKSNPELVSKRSKLEEIEKATLPSTPFGSKAIFGSAAKSIVTFNSIGSASCLPVKNLFAEEKNLLQSSCEPSGQEVESRDFEVITGEEDERNINTTKGKLFEFDSDSKEWHEKGLVIFKLNQSRQSGKHRIIVRSEGVQKLVLNSNLFSKMVCELVQEKNVRFSAYNFDLKIQTFLLRIKNATEANLLEEALNEVIKTLEPGPTTKDC